MTQLAGERLQITEQSTCIACGPHNPHGLGLSFSADADGWQIARWTATPTWEGFTGVIHGGILATLLDEAMAKAVVARGWEAVTGELTVRYHAPVLTGEELVIAGRVVEQRKRLIRAEAMARTAAGMIVLRAISTFVIVPGASVTPTHE